MALPYWIESILTMSYENDDVPGKLAYHRGVEYLYPIIPPNMSTHFRTSTVAGTFCNMLFRINFGYLVPGAFSLTLNVNGNEAYRGTLDGYSLENGLDTIHFLLQNGSLTAYITNLTPMNQRFEMTSQYLVVQSEQQYVVLKNNLEMMKFPNKLPVA